ncbi:polysaccharide deacetylase family protein [Demequina sediminicola]|uniref:polysaccharide deacetylase family protein n=1 Tax=Demequina sediminicola TaxID=1095026 RepID=UPI000A80480B|nr:polysaccharide deacetylase family protein [Demequina sediminicola]
MIFSHTGWVGWHGGEVLSEKVCAQEIGDVVEGIDVVSQENIEDTHHTYESYPTIPGADALTTALEDAVSPVADRFRETENTVTDAGVPELTVSWDLVGASPDTVGVRLAFAEHGGDAFDGRAETWWYDVASGDVLPATALLDTDALAELFERIEEVASDNSRIDQQMLEEHLAGETESLHSLAFTTEGDLWVEFDRAQVSHDNTPIGIAVSADGVLSDFGDLAKESAMTPTDPAIAVPEPSPENSDTASADGSGEVIVQDGGSVDCSSARCIALTFDDGPVEGTNALLDVLASRGVKATFFMVGTNVEANPDVVARIHNEGHALGNHTMDHPQLTRLDEASIRDEIESTNDLIEAATGERSVLLRPPYGATNDTVSAVAADLGMAQILWDVDPEDWKDHDSAIVTERVESHAHDGAIILSHDIHETTRNAYAGIIDNLLGQGYTLVTVPELFGELTPGQKYFNR